MAGLSGLIVEQQEREIWARIQVAVVEEPERCANMVPIMLFGLTHTGASARTMGLSGQSRPAPVEG